MTSEVIRYWESPEQPGYWFADPREKGLQQVAVQYGVAYPLARKIAYADLRGWNPEELETVLKKGPRNVKHLYTVQRNEGEGFTKPPSELVARAAQQKLALCINAAGEWSLRSSGFVAISHVWSEGLFADLENRGLPSETLDELFGLLESIDASWIWLDSLAVPGGFVHLSNAEENIKVDLINNLNMIYEKALAVVVLDARVMNVESNDPLDIAVTLICGKWRSRLWTYQEGKLARNVQLLTKGEVVDMHDLVSQLAVRSGYENHKLRATTDKVELEARRRYRGPYLSLKSLIKQMHIDRSSALEDLVDGCGYREASLNIDYARAIFPPLGLVWKEKYTRQDGMRLIFKSRKEEAMRLVLSFNAPRFVEGYGWAPSFLEGLDIIQFSKFRWEALGIRKTTKWKAYKVKGELLNKAWPKMGFMFNLGVELDHGLAEQYTCGLELSQRESPNARKSFLNACEKGEGFMLSDKPLKAAPPGDGSNAVIVLLVKALTQSCEAFVYMTAWMRLFERSYNPAQVDWLICHHSPLDEKEEHLLHVAPEVVWQNSTIERTKDETTLHLASRTRDVDSLKKLILGKANLDVTDGRGWTALHVCSAIGYLECVSLLLENGASVSVLTKQNDSAMSLAIQGGHNKIVTALIDQGAPLRVEGPSDPLLVALKTHNHVAISSLLSNGAIPNIQDEHGVPAVFYALKRPLILQALLDSGGQVHQFHPSGQSLLSAAAAGGYKASLDILLKTEVAVDTLDIGKPLTALYHAVNAQEHDCLRILISAQANVNRIFPGNVSAIMIATANNDFVSAEMLLQAGARLDVRSGPDQETPLHLAIARGHARIAKLFFSHLNSHGQEVINSKNGRGLSTITLAEKLSESIVARWAPRRTSGPISTVIGLSIAIGSFLGCGFWLGWKIYILAKRSLESRRGTLNKVIVYALSLPAETFLSLFIVRTILVLWRDNSSPVWVSKRNTLRKWWARRDMKWWARRDMKWWARRDMKWWSRRGMKHFRPPEQVE